MSFEIKIDVQIKLSGINTLYYLSKLMEDD